MTNRLIANARPEVQRKILSFAVGSERANNRGFSLAQELADYARAKGVPEGVLFTSTEDSALDLIEYRWEWWEVTW